MLRIVRVSKEQYRDWMYVLKPENRWVIEGLACMHAYFPGENILVLPSEEIAVSEFPEGEVLSIASVLHSGMEGK